MDGKFDNIITIRIASKINAKIKEASSTLNGSHFGSRINELKKEHIPILQV